MVGGGGKARAGGKEGRGEAGKEERGRGGGWREGDTPGTRSRLKTVVETGPSVREHACAYMRVQVCIGAHKSHCKF